MPFIGVQPAATAITATSLDGVTSTAAELNILDGVTSTAAELNILDGVTSTAAELNILDGVTATAAELNYLDITTLGGSEASKVVTANSSGNVGIGTNTIAAEARMIVDGGRFYINSDDQFGLLLQNAGASGGFIGTTAANTLNFYNSAGSERMRIDSSGNVGIGSSSNFSGARVAINDSPPTAFGSPMLQIGQETFVGNGYYSLGLGYTGSGYTEPPAEIAAISTSSSGGTTADIVFGTRSVTTNTAVTERMRIISTGVVQFENGLSEKYTAVTSSSNATTVDLLAGTNFSHTLTENTTFTFSNPTASGRVSAFTLKLVQDSSASGYTVTWPSSVDWPSATAPTLTATANAVDYFVFITHDGGTNYYGFTAGQALG